MSRLDSTFDHLRAAGAKGLVAFVTAGDPDLRCGAELVKAMDRAGADVIELGVPYSDPVADGPTIQRASERAIRAGATLTTVLEMVSSVRADVQAPIVLFSYANPIFRMGLAAFGARARAAGVDGVLAVDLPVEESVELRHALGCRGLAQIFLVSPTTSDARLARTAGAASGFVYAISRLGVTGADRTPAADAGAVVARIRAHTPLPVAVGFGISTPAQVRAAVQQADAAVVGSAIVSVIEREASVRERVADCVEAHVRWLRTGLDGDGQ